MSVAAISETIANDELLLEMEYEWAKKIYPGANIDMEIVAGSFLGELKDKTKCCDDSHGRSRKL